MPPATYTTTLHRKSVIRVGAELLSIAAVATDCGNSPRFTAGVSDSSGEIILVMTRPSLRLRLAANPQKKVWLTQSQEAQHRDHDDDDTDDVEDVHDPPH